MKNILLYLALIPAFAFAVSGRQIINFNAGWQFCNQEDLKSANTKPTDPKFSFTGWKTVSLPHTAKAEPLVIKNPWTGISWYKKDFKAKKGWNKKKVSIRFEAIMQYAEIWFNGKHIATHKGGYTPFSIDLTGKINFKGLNRLVVMADNRDNEEIPPGKPIKNLDFCYYSGIYRNVNLTITDPLHITDAVYENIPAWGGLYCWFPEITKDSAVIAFSTHIRNENNFMKTVHLTYELYEQSGKYITGFNDGMIDLEAGKDTILVDNIMVKKPLLWHPNHPDLYKLSITVNDENGVIDNVTTTIGIRKFEIKDDKFLINDEPLLLVGTNRHQEYPFIGNALSDNAQYRDAVKIKEAGFNIVRLSHYPQSPAFMDACDELGILTIAAIPGWQFAGNEAFMQQSYQDARDLIRRDRNHASVAMWELSLNESPMPDNFMEEMTKIAKEECPQSKIITCGWLDKYYDVFIPARQHAKKPDYWKQYTGKPLFTAEYGDWEYFAQDAGLNQTGYAGLKSNERTSRQLRGDGEKRMLQQALNFQEAHNDNLRNPHLGDANWLMFDYNRGYSPDIESSGIMDIFRLPKLAYYFYKSQTNPDNANDRQPFVKVASYWNQQTDTKNLKVYSNCDEVELFLNGKSVERHAAVRDNFSDRLPHPPFVFSIPTFEPGELKAVGYIHNKKAAEDIVATAGQPAMIKLSYDKSGKELKADDADVVFVYATVCDADGNPVPDSKTEIRFAKNGSGRLIGHNPIDAEAGIATILLQAGYKKKKILIEATASGLEPGKLIIKPVADK